MSEPNHGFPKTIDEAFRMIGELKQRAEKAEKAIQIILGIEPRYKGFHGKQHDGCDVDLEVCSLCDYADGHDENCLIPVIEQKEDETEEKLVQSERERDRLKIMGEKVNAIRNSIIGMQGFNFSEHAYPLVAALNEAGFKGLDYPEAKASLGTLLEQRDKAEKERDQLRALLQECYDAGPHQTSLSNKLFEALAAKGETK